MHEVVGILEISYEGDVIKSTGEFEKKDSKEINEFTKNILYILQDINSIKSKLTNPGNFIKIRIRSDRNHYEVAVGSSFIRINKYNTE